MRIAKPKQRLIVVPAFERAQLLDVSGPVQTFASANEIVGEAGGEPPYRIAVVSRYGGSVTTSSGLPLVTQPARRAIDAARIDTLIIPGGPGVHEALKDKRTVASLRHQAAGARRVASVCTGAFYWPRPVCSTVAAPPHIGNGAGGFSSATRTFASNTIRFM